MAEIISIHPPGTLPSKHQAARREPQPSAQRSTRPRVDMRPEPLWREVLGRRLREMRERQHKTLTETAARAGISPQYLSEIERGLKEPSSEMISAVIGALGMTLLDVTEQVHGELRRYEQPLFTQAHLPPASGQVMVSLALVA